MYVIMFSSLATFDTSSVTMTKAYHHNPFHLLVFKT